MNVHQIESGCHCGAVRFRVELHEPVQAHACNCSICVASGFVGVIIPSSRFTLLQGGEALSEYRFNTGVARHLFCKHCGVKSFYRPRSNPDGVSINANLLTLPTGVDIEHHTFDGQHWEVHAHTLKHLTGES